MGLISRVSSRTYRSNLIKIIMSANAVAASSAKPVAQPAGIYRHPYVWNGVADARVQKLPADGRLLRDIKVAEVPGWLMARDVSPVGVWYSLKRAMMRSMTIHHSDKVAMHRFSFFQTKCSQPSLYSTTSCTTDQDTSISRKTPNTTGKKSSKNLKSTKIFEIGSIFK